MGILRVVRRRGKGGAGRREGSCRDVTFCVAFLEVRVVYCPKLLSRVFAALLLSSWLRGTCVCLEFSCLRVFLCNVMFCLVFINGTANSTVFHICTFGTNIGLPNAIPSYLVRCGNMHHKEPNVQSFLSSASHVSLCLILKCPINHLLVYAQGFCCSYGMNIPG